MEGKWGGAPSLFTLLIGKLTWRCGLSAFPNPDNTVVTTLLLTASDTQWAPLIPTASGVVGLPLFSSVLKSLAL